MVCKVDHLVHVDTVVDDKRSKLVGKRDTERGEYLEFVETSDGFYYRRERAGKKIRGKASRTSLSTTERVTL